MTETATTRLEAHFECSGGTTQLAHYRASAPLKIAKTFPRGSAVAVCVMDVSPGLLNGDYYEIDWRLSPGAEVYVTTQGFTRVHPGAARLTQNIAVASGAAFHYHPEPLMLYKDASLRSHCEIDIEAGGTLTHSEILSAGRIERDEAFQFKNLRSRLHVRYGGELAYVNQTYLSPQDQNPRRLGGWGGYTHQANFLFFSHSINSATCDALRAVLEADNAPQVWGGVSLLEKSGVIVSLMGNRAWDLQQAIERLRLCLGA